MSDLAKVGLPLVRAFLALLGGLREAGINYREIMDAEEAARAEGREFGAADAQAFIDQAQSAVDEL